MSNLTMSKSNSRGYAFENHFSRCVNEIISATLNIKLSVSNISPEDEKLYSSFITGLMVFNGKENIILTLTFSKTAAARIVVSLLDVKYTELEEVGVYDAVMEITNMISGKIKTAITTPDNQYQLTTPFVFVGQNHFIESQARPNGMVKKFFANKFKILSGIYFL